MSFELAIVNADLNILQNGDFQVVVDSPKLVQDIVKLIVTPIGADNFNPWYGCAINQRILGRNLAPQFMLQEIQSSIAESLDNLKQIQLSQISVQTMSLAEQIQTIKSINVTYDPNDNRQLNVAVTVIAKDLSQVQEVFTMNS